MRKYWFHYFDRGPGKWVFCEVYCAIKPRNQLPHIHTAGPFSSASEALNDQRFLQAQLNDEFAYN